MVISLSQVEAFLEKPKGEDNFREMYQNLKREEIKQIAKVFLQTKMPEVFRLDEFMTGMKATNTRMRVVGVHGEKGMGKSTLISALLLNRFLSGDIDGIRYLRYSKESKSFDEIFKLGGEEARIVAVVIDDLHYFRDDLKKGTAAEFSRAMREIAKIAEDRSIKLFLYVSDTHSVKSVLSLYLEALDTVRNGQSDTTGSVIAALPTVPGQSSGSNPNQITLGREFYSKTYIQLQGNQVFYEIAEMFGTMIRDELKIPANNPRLLRDVIKMVAAHANEIDFSVFRDTELAVQILKGKIITSHEIEGHFYSKIDRAISSYYTGLSGTVDVANKELTQLRRTFGLLSDSMSMISAYKETYVSLNPEIKLPIFPMLETYRKILSKGEKASREIAPPTKAKPVNHLSTFEEVISSWVTHAKNGMKVGISMSEAFENVVKVHAELQNAKFENTLLSSLSMNQRVMGIGFGARPAANIHGALDIANSKFPKLEPAITNLRDMSLEFPQKVMQTYDDKIELFDKQLAFYKRLASEGDKISKVNQVYIQIRGEVQSRVQRQPDLFTVPPTITDLDGVKAAFRQNWAQNRINRLGGRVTV